MPKEILIQAIDQRWRPGIRIAVEEGYEKYIIKFCRFMAFVMQKELQRAIDEQRYIKNWPPLSVQYYEYKKKKGLSLKIWEATGLLVDSITYWRSNDRWVVGIPRKVKYPGTNFPVYKVAKMMEYGTEKMPARKLFYPLYLYLRKHIRVFWNAFIESEVRSKK